MFMNYFITYLGGILKYHAIDMITNIESDSDYLVLLKSFSRAAAWFIFRKDPENYPIQ